MSTRTSIGFGASSSSLSSSSSSAFFPFLPFFAGVFLPFLGSGALTRSSTQRGRSSMAGVNSRQSPSWSTESTRSRGATAEAAATLASADAPPLPIFSAKPATLSSAAKREPRTSAHSRGMSSTSLAPLPFASIARQRSAATERRSAGASLAASGSASVSSSAAFFPFLPFLAGFVSAGLSSLPADDAR